MTTKMFHKSKGVDEVIVLSDDINGFFDGIGLQTHKLSKQSSLKDQTIDYGKTIVYKRIFENGEEISPINIGRQVIAESEKVKNEELKYIEERYQSDLIVTLRNEIKDRDRRIVNYQEATMVGWLLVGMGVFVWIVSFINNI